ncbi:OmpA family protein [Thermaurantimonas aggregans]|nr:OmpA family protein [Thermaurantimonas aggregans]
MAFGNVSFSANDRFVKPDGTLWTDAPFFDRGLNAETSIYDASIGLIFKTDNLKWLSHRSFIAPYIGVHAVLLNFETYADLRDNEGNFYNLSNPALRQNGDYETLLTGLKTEGVDYQTIAFGGRLELGFRIRLSRQINLNLSTQLTVTTTDYLDDVSMNYPTQFNSQLQQRASDPTNRRQTTSKRGDDFVCDSYLFHSVGIQWSFGSQRRLKKFPSIGGYAPPPSLENTPSKFDPAVMAQRQLSTLNLSDSLIYVIENQQKQISDLRVNLNKAILEIQILKSRQKISELQSEKITAESKLSEINDSIRILNNYKNEIALDTILPKEVRDSIYIVYSNHLEQLELKKYSLENLLKTLKSQNDSLQIWISNQEKNIEEWPTSETVIQPAFSSQNSKINQEVDQTNAQQISEVKKVTPQALMPTNTSEPPSIEQQLSMDNEPSQNKNKVGETSELFPSQKRPENAKKTRSSTTTTLRQSNEVKNPNSVSVSPSEMPNRSSENFSDTSQTTTDSTAQKSIVEILERQTKILELLAQKVQTIENQINTEKLTQDDQSIKENTEDNLADKREITEQDNSPIWDIKATAGFKTRGAIYFESGKAKLSSAEESHLREIARYLADSTSSIVLLRGYADNTGPKSLNFRLIENRLDYVKTILIEEGVQPSRIKKDKGGVIVKPLQKAQPRDRRVEILLQ